MRKDFIALKRVARYTNKFPRIACINPVTELDSNIEVFGNANVAGCVSTRQCTVRGVPLVEWPVRDGVVQNHGNSGFEVVGVSELAAVVRAARIGWVYNQC